jgi:hypothetical protein
VLIKAAKAGKPAVSFEWNYQEELQDNKRVLERFEKLKPYSFDDESVPDWYKQPIPDYDEKKYQPATGFFAKLWESKKDLKKKNEELYKLRSKQRRCK